MVYTSTYLSIDYSLVILCVYIFMCIALNYAYMIIYIYSWRNFSNEIQIKNRKSYAISYCTFRSIVYL